MTKTTCPPNASAPSSRAASLDDIDGARELLEGSSILSHLTPTARAGVMDRLSLRMFRAGDVLFGPQESGEPGVHFVVSGTLNVYARAHSRRGALLAVVTPGELLGEYRALTGTAGDVEVGAETPAVTAVLSHADFLRLLENWPELNQLLLQRLISTARRLSTRVDDIHVLDGEVDRIYFELLRASI